MQTEKISLVVTVLAAAALARYRLVDFAGAPAASGVRVLGTPQAEFDAGDWAGIAVRGELLVEAGGAVVVGAEVESDATGRAVTKTTGIAFGVARDAATAAGDLIRVLR